LKKGKVYIVGAGPGDPELLTLKGKRLLETAEVVIYDRLVSDEILDFIPLEAERIFVGKEPAFHSIPQRNINGLLVTKAKSGKSVVRLKGGDPYTFGRGGEEGEALAAEDIPFEVIPGVSAASGAAAYAGIPLTDRRCSSGVTFVTGHKRAGKDLADINWKALAGLNQTIVFYMGIKNLPTITKNLRSNGMAKEMPAAVVRLATTKEQKTVTGTLENIKEKVEAATVRPPALLVVGKVVNLRTFLNWFDK